VKVDHLDLLGVRVFPQEADPILVVDSSAVLPTPTSTESLQVVPWERAEVVESLRCV
jgi:hypothetical protein